MTYLKNASAQWVLRQDSYLTGEFKVAGKPAYLLIYTKSHPIMKIETREKVYYYTAREGQETTKIYQEIKAKLP